MAADVPPERTLRRPRRASTLVALLVAVVTGVGITYLGVWPRMTSVYAPASDLPAYWQLQKRDVRSITVPARDVPDDAVRSRSDLIGRYTQTAVEQDKPFISSRLGPQLPSRALSGLRILAFEATVAASSGGALVAGDRADMLIPQPAGQIAIPDVLVVDERRRPAAVVVALTESQQRRLAAVRGSVRPLLVRLPPPAP